MSREKEITLYSFSELPDDIKIGLIQDFEIDHEWDDPVIQTIEQEAEEIGINNFDVYYSGFWSQGDGLSFIGTLSEDLVEKIYKENINRDGFGPENPPFTVEFVRIIRHYCHSKVVEARIDDCLDDEAYQIFEKVFNEWKDNQCEQWYLLLKESFESLMSEPFIREHYEDCGEIFLADGRIL
jgi:hypothetical protein